MPEDDARLLIIRTYERWMARTVGDPVTGGEVTSRELIERYFRRFALAIREGSPYEPTEWIIDRWPAR